MLKPRPKGDIVLLSLRWVNRAGPQGKGHWIYPSSLREMLEKRQRQIPASPSPRRVALSRGAKHTHVAGTMCELRKWKKGGARAPPWRPVTPLTDESSAISLSTSPLGERKVDENVPSDIIPNGKRSKNLFPYVLSWAKLLQSCQLCSILWTVAHQAPLSMGFSRKECWSGLPCPPCRVSSRPRDRTCIGRQVPLVSPGKPGHPRTSGFHPWGLGFNPWLGN